MNKKLKYSLLSLSAVTILAACGNGGGDTSDQQQSPEQTTEEMTEGSTDQGSQESSQNEMASDDQSSTEESTSGSQDTSGESSDQSNQSSSDTPGIENEEFATSLDDAVQTFYREVGDENAGIEQIDFDDEGGNYQYEIQGYSNNTEYEVDINADTGEVVNTETDDDEDEDELIDLEGIISPSEAMQIAIDDAGDGFVDEWTLDEDDGMTLYDISINTVDDDIEIDAHSGEIVDR